MMLLAALVLISRSLAPSLPIQATVYLSTTVPPKQSSVLKRITLTRHENPLRNDGPQENIHSRFERFAPGRIRRHTSLKGGFFAFSEGVRVRWFVLGRISRRSTLWLLWLVCSATGKSNQCWKRVEAARWQTRRRWIWWRTIRVGSLITDAAICRGAVGLEYAMMVADFETRWQARMGWEISGLESGLSRFSWNNRIFGFKISLYM